MGQTESIMGGDADRRSAISSFADSACDDAGFAPSAMKWFASTRTRDATRSQLSPPALVSSTSTLKLPVKLGRPPQSRRGCEDRRLPKSMSNSQTDTTYKRRRRRLLSSASARMKSEIRDRKGSGSMALHEGVPRPAQDRRRIPPRRSAGESRPRKSRSRLFRDCHG